MIKRVRKIVFNMLAPSTPFCSKILAQHSSHHPFLPAELERGLPLVLLTGRQARVVLTAGVLPAHRALIMQLIVEIARLVCILAVHARKRVTIFWHAARGLSSLPLTRVLLQKRRMVLVSTFLPGEG